MAQNFHVLAKITAEPPALPPIEHASAHILNAPIFERKYARAYLGDPESRESVSLRRQIASGARQALEEQYWDILERTVHSRPMEARLGGDPSVPNKVRAFLLIRFYRNGEWEDRIEVRQHNISLSRLSLSRQISWWLDNLYGHAYFTSYGQGMSKMHWMKQLCTNRLLSIVKRASSTFSEHGSSLQNGGE
jgi:hypothetical protein